LPAEPRIAVESELSDRVEAAFEGMTLTREAGNTSLEGFIRDQAELQGVLRRVSDFGLTLVSATAIREQAGKETTGT
jgi:hypothetical protein